MRVLISVFDKSGLVSFAKKLSGEIIATQGTANFLRTKGIDVKDISVITGMDESRELKTIHNRIYTDIFSGNIGMVVVNLYPFEEEPCIENIDIGGVCLLRAAAKNYKKVLAVCNPNQYGRVLSNMNDLDESFRLKLASEVFDYIARYERAISRWFSEKRSGE
jgi:phosphoribosylaminoimidazolecarboxamide formyltransferase/IMP cyclohydrolase